MPAGVKGEGGPTRTPVGVPAATGTPELEKSDGKTVEIPAADVGKPRAKFAAIGIGVAGFPVETKVDGSVRTTVGAVVPANPAIVRA